MVSFELVWNKQQFDFIYATPATAAPKATCEVYVEQEFDPYSLCTKGQGVQYLQQALIYFGYLAGNADGLFGPGTEGAVRAAQRDYEVTQDGIATGSWYRELIETYNLLREPDPTPPPQNPRPPAPQPPPQPYVVSWFCNPSGFGVNVMSDGRNYHTGIMCQALRAD